MELQERLTKIKADPQRWLKKATDLVDRRGHDNYVKAAEILADVREAVVEWRGARLPANMPLN